MGTEDLFHKRKARVFKRSGPARAPYEKVWQNLPRPMQSARGQMPSGLVH